MSNLTLEFIQKMFLKYYTECFSEISIPYSFEKREFGALLFKEKIMVRHKKFKTAEELQKFVCTFIPSDVYFSSAYYKQSDASEMSEKGWIGADLIFDIDADHIPTPCDKIHDDWTCAKCNFTGKGVTPEKCPACGGEKFNAYSWPCELCINSAKEESVKLLEMLENDFGFSKNDVHVFFSGHRGYHVHIENEAVITLDSVARKEIVDYVTGLGFSSIFADAVKKATLEVPRLDDFGWRGRIARGIYTFVENAGKEDFEHLGLPKTFVAILVKNKSAILKSLKGVGSIGAVKGIGPETWKKLAEHSLQVQSAKVDTVVTSDIHRLIRLAGTLHGKTGFKKVKVPVSDIEGFDPFKSAIAFKSGFATVNVYNAPEFRLGEEMLGPYKNQSVELPVAAALLLVCKGRADVTEYNV